VKPRDLKPVRALEKILENAPGGGDGSMDIMMLVWAVTLVTLLGLLLREVRQDRN